MAEPKAVETLFKEYEKLAEATTPTNRRKR
jgi:hypothetical protein